MKRMNFSVLVGRDPDPEPGMTHNRDYMLNGNRPRIAPKGEQPEAKNLQENINERGITCRQPL